MQAQSINRFRSQYSNLKFPDERWVIHCAFFSKGVISFSTSSPHDERNRQLLERFAQVFEGINIRRPHGSVWTGGENTSLPDEL